MSNHQATNLMEWMSGLFMGVVFAFSHSVFSFLQAHPYIELCIRATLGGVFGTCGALILKSTLKQVSLWTRRKKQ